MKNLLLFIFIVAINIVLATPLTDRVLVIRNTNSPSSISIANDYMSRRGVTKVLDISIGDASLSTGNEYISFNEIYTNVEVPLLAYLATHPEIDFIVLTKGLPIHFYDFPGQPYGGVCSVDSYIASLNGYKNNPNVSYVKVSDPNYNFGADIFIGHAWINKFWKSNDKFSHTAFGGYMVSRLDGYTVSDAIKLTTNSLKAEQNLALNQTNTGTILLDAYAGYGFPDPNLQPWTLLPTNYAFGDTILITSESPFGDINADMSVAKDLLMARAIPAIYEITNTFVGSSDSLKGYFSWGSNDGSYSATTYQSLKFYPGAIAETAVSTGGRTFLPTIGGQSLIVDLIAQGVTGIKGYTDEPLLQAIASPSILFDKYTKGWTMAESFFAASRMVGWMDILIGDPICIAYADPTAALQNFSKENKLFFPNPSQEELFLENDQSITLIDISGKVVLEQKVTSGKINIKHLSYGTYTVILNKNGSKKMQKLIKID